MSLAVFFSPFFAEVGMSIVGIIRRPPRSKNQTAKVGRKEELFYQQIFRLIDAGFASELGWEASRFMIKVRDLIWPIWVKDHLASLVVIPGAWINPVRQLVLAGRHRYEGFKYLWRYISSKEGGQIVSASDQPYVLCGVGAYDEKSAKVTTPLNLAEGAALALHLPQYFGGERSQRKAVKLELAVHSSNANTPFLYVDGSESLVLGGVEALQVCSPTQLVGQGTEVVYQKRLVVPR